MIKFPSPGAGKDVKCPGYARGMPGGGGMLKLRFDWYISVESFFHSIGLPIIETEAQNACYTKCHVNVVHINITNNI